METEITFRNLSKDLLFSLAIQLDLSDLLKFCSSSKQINDYVCKKDNIWLYKLNQQFPNWRELKLDTTIKNPISLFPIVKAESIRDIYITLYYWNIFKILKEKLKIEEDLYKIYLSEKLYLRNKQLTEIPKEIGFLTNLHFLYLNWNKLTEIPKEIGGLKNLKHLYLNNNLLTEIPKEIGQLKNLQILALDSNLLKTIPKEIGELKNLQLLNLKNNPLTTIPEEIRNLDNLTIFG